MVKATYCQMYEPAPERGDAMAANGWERGKEDSPTGRPGSRLLEGCPDQVTSRPTPRSSRWETSSRSPRSSQLGSLSPDDVAVELLHGPVGPNDDLTDTETIAQFELAAGGDGGPTTASAGPSAARPRAATGSPSASSLPIRI